jgi:hypothetical protein
MNVSNRRLGWSQRPTRKVVTTTQPYLVRQIRAEVKDPTKARERMRSQPHNQERTSVKSSAPFLISTVIIHHSDQARRKVKESMLNLKQLQEPFSGRMAKTLAEI